MLFNFVIELLKKPRSELTDSEGETICNWLIQNFQIFSKINKETVDDIVNNSRLCECEKNSLIIKQGEPGASFFLILDGRVSVFINTDAVSDQVEETIVNIVGKEYKKKEFKDAYIKVTDKSKFGNFIGFIEAGSGFGEMALISDDVRSATIISEEDCLLLILDKTVYNRSLRLYQEAEFKAFTAFVNSSPIFHNWAPRYKKQVAMSLRRVIFPFDQEIIRQGEKNNGIGFIIDGQAKVIMDITLHSQQYPEFELVDHLITNGTSYGNSSSLEKSLGKVKNVRHLEISLVGPGEIIGDIEHIKGLNTSYKTILPIEPTEVYFLSEKNFERLVTSKRNQTTGEMLRKWVDKKLLSQFVRPLYKQIPLIEHLVQLILKERLKIKEQVIEAQSKKLSVLKANDFINRGPLIDMYGPGTVFYRNRQLRQKKKINTKANNQKPLSITNVTEIKKNIPETYHNSGLERDPTFLDWETSTNKLDKLETKILSWYETDVQNKNEKVNIPRLQRFIKKEDEIVKPGKTILLKPRKSHTLSELVLKTNLNQDQSQEVRD